MSAPSPANFDPAPLAAPDRASGASPAPALSVQGLPELADCWRSTLNWCPSPAQQQQFEAIYRAIVEANQFLNLTRLTTPEDFWEKHLWDSFSGLSFFLPAVSLAEIGSESGPESPADSLPESSSQSSAESPSESSSQSPSESPAESASHSPADSPAPAFTPALPQPQRIIDIGTGGGFPGLPAAVLWPDSAVTLLDATRKKILFLEGLIDRLGLATVTALAGRAEAVGQDPQQRETYDLALVRAVGGVTVCAEYALPLVRRGGHAVLYRGQWSEAEAESLESAALDLGGVVAAVQPFQTPITGAMRHCVLIRKEADTPEGYPRSIGVPTQRPLGV